METVWIVTIWDFITAKRLSITNWMCIDMTVKKWGNQHRSGDTGEEATSVWGKKLLGGYAGVKWTAKEIVDEVKDLNKYKLWVEPFSGLGRTAKYIDLPKVLNDKSEFANKYCKETFPDSVVENMDFMNTIDKYDSEDTFFLIDPPWRFATYDVNNLAFCDRKPWDYYDQLLKRIETLKGDWFLLNSADEHETNDILRNSKWGLKIVESEGKVIFGKPAKTMICSNMFDPNIKDQWISSESGKTKGKSKTKYAEGKTSVWGTKKLGGYAGVKHTAKEIVNNAHHHLFAFVSIGLAISTVISCRSLLPRINGSLTGDL